MWTKIYVANRLCAASLQLFFKTFIWFFFKEKTIIYNRPCFFALKNKSLSLYIEIDLLIFLQDLKKNDSLKKHFIHGVDFNFTVSIQYSNNYDCQNLNKIFWYLPFRLVSSSSQRTRSTSCKTCQRWNLNLS